MNVDKQTKHGNEQGRAEDAMAAFQMALARTPDRILSLAGYARAAVAAGRLDMAASTYSTLARLLENADGDMSEALEARGFLEAQTEQSQ